MDNLFGVSMQRSEGKLVSEGVPEVQEKNMQYIAAGTKEDVPHDDVKRPRHSTGSPSPDEMSSSPSEGSPSTSDENNFMGDSDEETSTSEGVDTGDNRKMKVLSFQLKRSYIENPRYK